MDKRKTGSGNASSGWKPYSEKFPGKEAIQAMLTKKKCLKNKT